MKYNQIWKMNVNVDKTNAHDLVLDIVGKPTAVDLRFLLIVTLQVFVY